MLYYAFHGFCESTSFLDLATLARDVELRFSRKGIHSVLPSITDWTELKRLVPGRWPTARMFFAGCSGHRIACELCGHQSGPQVVQYYQKRETRSSSSSWFCFQHGRDLRKPFYNAAGFSPGKVCGKSFCFYVRTATEVKSNFDDLAIPHKPPQLLRPVCFQNIEMRKYCDYRI